MVDPAAAPGSGDDTGRNAKNDTDDGGDGGQFQGGRKHPADIVEHQVRGEDRAAELAVQGRPDVTHELFPQRQIEPEFDAHPLVGRGVYPVADGGQDRVDRHHPADEEGDGQQAEKGNGHRRESPQNGAAVAEKGVPGARRVPGRAGRCFHRPFCDCRRHAVPSYLVMLR